MVRDKDQMEKLKQHDLKTKELEEVSVFERKKLYYYIYSRFYVHVYIF